ncbi:hypothetical protein CALVIDRAFT_542109 [Calocera viscosa TUFC12733]|uniref:Uncharacterized protein n=1 Tax=Calocera viscosa (strain TUFC12733) TaxID=1330018 RepID=A0A167GYS1_CALVF|nr:hypothetical protein CALVIDRAFT_542109 [Calocera viscosa TUFC12733]
MDPKFNTQLLCITSNPAIINNLYMRSRLLKSCTMVQVIQAISTIAISGGEELARTAVVAVIALLFFVLASFVVNAPNVATTAANEDLLGFCNL